MLIVEFHDAITSRACLLCEKRERLEANYHQKVTAWSTDKTSLVQCNLVGHVLALLYVLKVHKAFSDDLPDISMGNVL
jgi:hypothetical protein